MHNRRNRSGVSIGTVATLVVLALVIIGCAVLFPSCWGMWSSASVRSR